MGEKCFSNCLIMAFIIGIIGLFAGRVSADTDYTYKRGQDRYVVYTCDDAVQREDGTSLCNASMGSLCENEIDHVTLCLSADETDMTVPSCVQLSGGCYGRAMSVDLHNYPVNTLLHVYGTTTATDGMESRVSDDNINFTTYSANPMAPGRIRHQ